MRFENQLGFRYNRTRAQKIGILTDNVCGAYNAAIGPWKKSCTVQEIAKYIPCFIFRYVSFFDWEL